MKAYVSPIVMGILVSLVIIYVVFIPIAIQQYRKHGNLKIRRNIVLASFILYFITAWFMTILPLPSIEDVMQMEPIKPNLRPFLFIEAFLKSWLCSYKAGDMVTSNTAFQLLYSSL